MIQDIGAEFDSSFAIRTAAPGRTPCSATRGKASPSRGAPLSFPTAADFAPERLSYLFRVGGEDYYLAGCGDRRTAQDSRTGASCARRCRRTRAFAAITGMHLNYWYRRTATAAAAARPRCPPKRSAPWCAPPAATPSIPTIAPAVIIGVVQRERILVSHYSGRPYSGPRAAGGLLRDRRDPGGDRPPRGDGGGRAPGDPDRIRRLPALGLRPRPAARAITARWRTGRSAWTTASSRTPTGSGARRSASSATARP